MENDFFTQKFINLSLELRDDKFFYIHPANENEQSNAYFGKFVNTQLGRDGEKDMNFWLGASFQKQKTMSKDIWVLFIPINEPHKIIYDMNTILYGSANIYVGEKIEAGMKKHHNLNFDLVSRIMNDCIWPKG